MREEDIGNLLVIKKGSGQKSKISGVEAEILKELEQNNYHTCQQIADMIKEKFQIQISVSAVGKFLKKRHQKVEERFPASKSRYAETACVL